MKLAAFGDAHFHLFAEFSEKDPKYGNTRLKIMLDVLDEMFTCCSEQGIKYVLFAGDMFHKRVLVDTLVKNLVYDLIREWSLEGNLRFIMIPGNHDQVDNSDFPQHSLHEFRDIPGVTILDDFTDITLEDEVTIYPVPYSKNVELVKGEIERYTELVKTRDTKSILLGHLGISGATVGKSRYAMQDAFGVGDLYPDVFDYGVFGHYHRRQHLDKYYHYAYTGSPLQHNFNDSGQNNGFVLIDTNEVELEFVNLRSPKFITVTSKDFDEEALKGNYVRFQIPAEEVEIVAELAKETKHRIEPQREFKSDIRIGIDHSMSKEEMIKKYCSEFNEDATSTLLDILAEVD